MDSIEELLSALNEGTIIERISISADEEIDNIFDSRDSDDFSSKWMESFNDIESQKPSKQHRYAETVAQIREVAYLKSFAKWKSPDLAAYVSDDFGLIADAISMKISDPWIEQILERYLAGAIPSHVE